MAQQLSHRGNQDGFYTSVDDVKAGLRGALGDMILDDQIFHTTNADNSNYEFSLTLSGTESERIAFDLALGEDAIIDPRLGIQDEVLLSFDWEFDLNFAVEADVHITQSFAGANTEDAQFGSPIDVDYQEVRLDLGTFFNEFVDPTVARIQDLLDPVKPIIDFLRLPIPVLSEVGYAIGIGKITPIDLGILSTTVNPKLNQQQKDTTLAGLTAAKATVEFLNVFYDLGPIAEGLPDTSGLVGFKVQLTEGAGQNTGGEKARAETLSRKHILSDKLMDEAEVQEKIARLEVESARLRHALAKVEHAVAEAQLERRTLRSSVSGVVTEVSKVPGEYIREQAPLLTVAQLNELYVEVYLPVAAYGRVEIGQAAMVEPVQPIGGSHVARVAVVDRVFDAASGTFGVRLSLPNPNGALPAGIRCTVAFDTVATDGRDLAEGVQHGQALP